MKAARQCVSAVAGGAYALLPSFFGGLITSGIADSLGATMQAASTAGIFGAVAAGTATVYALTQTGPGLSPRTATAAAAVSSAALGVASYIR
jgi:hypothetical protein